MGITVDVTYKSLNKYSEILCGDTVELFKNGGFRCNDPGGRNGERGKKPTSSPP